MKNFLTGTATKALIGSSATAGGMAEPIEMAPVEIIEDTAGSSSSAGLIVPLILIALIAAAASGSDSDTGNVGNASDMRLKEGIVPVGSTPSGLTLYEFSYIGSPERYVGVMAQEVLTHTPEAVIAQPSGVLFVDYSMIDAEMRRVD